MRIRKSWHEQLGRTDTSWHFYTAENDSVARLTDALNFYFEKSPDNEFSHVGGLFLLLVMVYLKSICTELFMIHAA